MRPPEISGEEPSVPGRKVGSPSLRKITQLTTLMGLSLLAQSGHGPRPPCTERSASAAHRTMNAGNTSHVSAEILERKRSELSERITACASCCSASEAMALAGICGDKPLTPGKLSEAAGNLKPELRSAVHEVALILREYPELAPHVLTSLHSFLDGLPMTDARRLAGLIIPQEDCSLDEQWNIEYTSREFLRLEQERGAYVPKEEYAAAGIPVMLRPVLTGKSDSVENK